MREPREIAERIREIGASYYPEGAEDAAGMMRAIVALTEAVQLTFYDYGEAVAGLGSLNPAYPEAIAGAAAGTGAVAEQLREIADALDRDIDRERQAENGGQGPVPDWVSSGRAGPAYPDRTYAGPEPDYDPQPGHIRSDTRGIPLLPGTLPAGLREERPEPDHHETFVPGYYGLRPPPPAPMSPREARKRARRARKNATPREGAGQWALKWAQDLHNRIP